jgi:CheY-like chemotaxis protein
LEGVGVLAVDDDEAIRGAISDVLTTAGARVATAATAAEAIRRLPEVKPDVLVLDIAMPHEDGYELMRTIRALPWETGGETPAVALSALATNADKLKALAAGFQAYLAKPTQGELLVSTILQVLRGRSKRDLAQGAEQEASWPPSDGSLAD